MAHIPGRRGEGGKGGSRTKRRRTPDKRAKERPAPDSPPTKDAKGKRKGKDLEEERCFAWNNGNGMCRICHQGCLVGGR